MKTPPQHIDALPCPTFQRVIQQGRLTPRILEVFAASGHPGILDLVSAMRIQSWTPPLLLGNGEAWLGDKSHLW